MLMRLLFNFDDALFDLLVFLACWVSVRLATPPTSHHHPPLLACVSSLPQPSERESCVCLKKKPLGMADLHHSYMHAGRLQSPASQMPATCMRPTRPRMRRVSTSSTTLFSTVLPMSVAEAGFLILGVQCTEFEANGYTDQLYVEGSN
jgi:hypothetical protein